MAADPAAETRLPAWLWWGGLVLMLASLMAPILVVDLPPLSDLPDHIARCYVLAFGAEDPVVRAMFAVHWDLVPNLGIDLVLPPLMHLMPPLAAGRLFVALVLLASTTGAVAFSLACFRRRSLWQLGAGFVAYNAMFLSGSLNFQLSVGLAFWGAACWVAASARHPRSGVAVGVLFALVTFVCHLFGFFLFALLIGCAELLAIWRRGLGDARARRFAIGRAGAVAVALLPPAVLYLTSPFAKAGGAVFWQSAKFKLFYLLVPVLGYSRLASVAVAAALTAAVLAWAVRGKLRVEPLAWIALPLLLVAYVLLPVGAKGAYWIDTRIPAILGFMLFAVCMPRRLGRREAILATAVLAVLFLARTAYITEVWAGSRQDVADVRQTLSPLTPGSRVLVLDADPQQHQWETGRMPASRIFAHNMATAYWHYGAFAMIDHRAFWSNAFAMSGQQPISPRPPYDASSDGGLAPPRDVALLAANATAKPSLDPHLLLAGWPGRFDYVLVLGADPGPGIDDILPQYLTLLEHHGIAALFRVKR